MLFIARLKAKCNHWQQPEKYKTSEAKFKKNGNSKNGKQNYKQSKYVEWAVQKSKITMYSTYSVGYKASEETS